MLKKTYQFGNPISLLHRVIHGATLIHGLAAWSGVLEWNLEWSLESKFGVWVDFTHERIIINLLREISVVNRLIHVNDKKTSQCLKYINVHLIFNRSQF